MVVYERLASGMVISYHTLLIYSALFVHSTPTLFSRSSLAPLSSLSAFIPDYAYYDDGALNLGPALPVSHTLISTLQLQLQILSFLMGYGQCQSSSCRPVQTVHNLPLHFLHELVIDTASAQLITLVCNLTGNGRRTLRGS